MTLEYRVGVSKITYGPDGAKDVTTTVQIMDGLTPLKELLVQQDDTELQERALENGQSVWGDDEVLADLTEKLGAPVSLPVEEQFPKSEKELLEAGLLTPGAE